MYYLSSCFILATTTFLVNYVVQGIGKYNADVPIAGYFKGAIFSG